MKISILTCFILLSKIVFPQEIPPDLLRKMEKAGQQKPLGDSLKHYYFTAEKGRITFSNGKTARFKSLTLKEDSVIYKKSDKNITTIPFSEVSLVTEIQRHKGLNALIAGGIGLVSGLLVGVLDYPDENNLSNLLDFIFNDEASELPKISPKSIPLIVGTTAAGALLGAFVITFKDEKKVIYRKKDIAVTFVPEVSAIPDVHPGYMLTARIRF